MGEKRFVSASERSVWLLEGALVYGRFQDARGHDSAKRCSAAWQAWMAGKSDAEIEAAKKLQSAGFDAALNITVEF